MFAPQNANDRDGLFMGLRLAGTTIQRSQAYYSITDSVWGTTTGTVDAKNLKGFWLELVPGIRVSPYKHFFMGWTVRAKFLFNPKDLSELAPLYIAGYGKGDKNAVFDINFYISYALFYHTKRIR